MRGRLCGDCAVSVYHQPRATGTSVDAGTRTFEWFGSQAPIIKVYKV